MLRKKVYYVETCRSFRIHLRYLGFLEACEVTLELAATLAAGQQGKWTVIAAVQTLK